MSTYEARPSGYDYTVREGQNNQLPPPTPGTAHQWVCTAVYTVSQASADRAAAAWMAGIKQEGISLDHENLASVQGPGCLKCGQLMTPTTYAQPCPVQVTYTCGHTT